VELAEPEGYVRTFVNEGTPLRSLLGEVDVLPAYAADLLAAFDETRAAPVKAVGAPASQPLVEPLTGRELDVLRLIARGQTNQKIADEFFISVNTIKTHAKHIYDRIFYSSVVVHLVERLWIYEGERDISQGFSEVLRGRRRRERDFVCGGKGRDLRAAGAQRRGQDQHAGMPGGSLNSEK